MLKLKLYKNHNGSIGTWEGWTAGAWVITESRKKIGGAPVKNSYLAKAKNVGRANETTADEQAMLELASKARLKVDKGYVETEAEAQVPATNSLGLAKPMLATPFDKVKTIDWRTAYIQPKLDGHRALYINGVLYSRQGKELKLHHITNQLKRLELQHLHLDGELYVHGMSLQDISRLVKKQSLATLKVEYHIYDIVSDKPFLERHDTLRLTHEDDEQAENEPNIKIVPIQGVSFMDSLMRGHEEYLAEGYEGTMLRMGTDGYQTDKRSRSLLKLKEFHDQEYPVVSYEMGKPYIRGDNTYNVPVWVCETPCGKRFNVTAAGDMSVKNDQWLAREQIIASEPLLTVKYHNLSKDQIPQLPVALRWKELI